MNLLIVTPIFLPELGGPATYVWELCQRLKFNHQITVLTFTSKPNKIKGVKVVALSKKGNSVLRQLNLFLSCFFYSINSDSIYIQGPLVMGLASAIASKITGTKSLLKFVGDEVWEHARLTNPKVLNLENFYRNSISPINYLKKKLQLLSLRLTDQIISPSNYLKNFLAKTYYLNPKKIKVIHNSVKVNTSSSNKKPYQLIFVGRLVPWKNVDMIIQAVKEARRKKPWKLIVVGEGPTLSNLKKLSKNLKAASWLKFSGRLSKPRTLRAIAQSRQLILYSDYEGLSHTLIEAMLSGTQIIASRIKSNSEVTGDHAKLVSPNDISKLAQAINQPSKDIEPAKKLAKARYSWNKHLSSLGKLL